MFRSTVLFSFLLPACVVAKVGSGDSATRTETFPSAEGFALHTLVDTSLTVTPGAQASVALTCDDSLLDDFRIEVVDGVLTLEALGDYALVPQTDCHAEVVVSALRSLTDTGSGRVEVDGLADGLAEVESTGSGGIGLDEVSACDLVIDHTGSGPVEIDALTACTVDVTSSGSGGTWLVGEADSATLLVTGSGGFGEADFVVGSADITVTGSGGVTIHGDPQERTVDTSGSGDVRFE